MMGSQLYVTTMVKFEDRIREIGEKLGIPSDYESRYGLSLQYEESSLTEIGKNIFDRKQFLSEEAAVSWVNMKNRAASDGVQLDVVSAFRSVDKQAEIIDLRSQNKRPAPSQNN